jgi:ABC-type lipoprotein release transport system permease subunit
VVGAPGAAACSNHRGERGVGRPAQGVVAGLVIGLAISAAISRFTASLLYGVSPTDLLTFALVPVVLLLTALAAVVVPARRPCAIRPMEALRLE